LEFAQKGSLVQDELEVVNLAEVIKSTVDEMKIKANRYGMNIKAALQEDYLINGVEGHLKEVLINLIDNAIKYGVQDTDITLNTKLTNGNVVMEIKNKSQYIPQEKLERLMIPFYRLDKSNKGERGSVGLGLSICKEILENHKGNMILESNTEGDYIVTITLPIAEEVSEIYQKT